MTTYQQMLDYLLSRLPMFSRLGAQAIKSDLTNTLALCAALHNPQLKFKSVHIAGTNGKGSTSHMLAAVMQKAGYKTGLYTSPHLKEFRERIKINGRMIDEAFVVGFTNKIQPLIEEIEPSFFEITVAMAFDWFAYEKVDVAIIETGLGGRLDSTNVILPELSIITNIGFDHMNLLGNTLPQIAAEKAGIIKPNIPVVVGEALPETRAVFERKAKEANAAITFATDEMWVAAWEQKNHYLQLTIAEKKTDNRQFFVLDLIGLYQSKNLLTVLEAVLHLKKQGWQISNDQLKNALGEVRKLTGLHGRWEVVHNMPEVVLDVAHNVDGIKQVVSQLEHCVFDRLHIVIGMVKDKEIDQVLALLPQYATYYFTRSQIPRALPEAELCNRAKNFNLHGNHYNTVQQAVQTALNHAHANDMVLVCGSVFIVGEVSTETLKF